jgi:hypothetical protein
MHAFTHGLISWIVAESVPGLERRDRALILAAGLVPDLDALTIVGGAECYQTWHRLICHNVLFAGVFVGFTALVARTRITAALLAAVTLHLHLVCDVLGSAGPDGSIWPVPYFLPFVRGEEHYIRWSGQWQLASWPNYVITIVALVVCVILGVTRRRTIVEPFSLRADAEVVKVLERRFGPRESS